MKPHSDIGKAGVPNIDEFVLTDFSKDDVDDHRPVTSVTDATTVVESLHTHRTNDNPPKMDKKSASKSSLLRFIPTFFEGFQEHIKSRLLNGSILMIFPAVIFAFFGSSAWIDTAIFSSPDSNPSLKSIFVPSFPLFIGKPAPDGFHPRLLISNRFTWPLSGIHVICSLETFKLQEDISNVFPECGPEGDHTAYPFCISPQVLSKNVSNNDGIVDLVDFKIHGLPGAYQMKCTADVTGFQHSTAFEVSLIGTVTSLQSSLADKYSSRIRLNTCGETIPLPQVTVAVKNVDPRAVARQVFLVALKYPALVALGLNNHDDFYSLGPGYPVVGIEHNPIVAFGDSTTSINAYLVSWSARAFVLAVVSEGRFNVLNYLEAPLHSKFRKPSQHISIDSCSQRAQFETIKAPPSVVGSSTPFSLTVRLEPAPLAPIRALLFAYCPKCFDGTMRKSGVLSTSKLLYSRESSRSSSGTFLFSSAAFTSFGEAGRYFYAVAVAGYIYPLTTHTDVSSPSVLLHLWTPKCFIDCSLTHLDVGRSYYRNPPYVSLRFASGTFAPSRAVKFALQSTASTASSTVVVSGSESDAYGFVGLASFSILVFTSDRVDSLSLSANSDTSISNTLAINGSTRHCLTPVMICSFISVTQGLPEHIAGGTYFSGIIQGTSMSSKGEGVSTEICIFFDGIPAACNTSDSSGNVNISNVFIPIPVSAEASSLVIWHLAENPANISTGTASLKRRCGYLPACRSFTMTSYISNNGSAVFSVVITNGRLSEPGVYAVSSSFIAAPVIFIELSCTFPQSSSCLALVSSEVQVKVLQVQRSSRAIASDSLADASCSYVIGLKHYASCTFLQGILWANIEVSFGGRTFRDIYIQFSDPSLSVSAYTPKYSGPLTSRDSDSLSALAFTAMVGGSIQYVNNIFFSTGIFAPFQHPALTLRIIGTNVDVALSTSRIIDQTLDPLSPIIDRSSSNLPDAPNLINGSRVEVFSKIDAPVSQGVYTLKLCFEFYVECFENVTLASLTVTQPSLLASALFVSDYAVLSRQGGNAPFLSVRVNHDSAHGILDSDRWSHETVLWSFHDAAKNTISTAFHSSVMKKHSDYQSSESSFDSTIGDELFAELLPSSFTPPEGWYHLSATASCCGQQQFSNIFLVDYAVQSLLLLSPAPLFLISSQTVFLSVDVRSLSGSGLPGRLVTITSSSSSPVSLCHASSCSAISNSLGIARIAFSISMATPGNHSFKIHSGNKDIRFATLLLSEAADFKIIKDIDPTGPADLTVNFPCAAALKLKSSIILTSKSENDWANYNFPEFRVADAAGNGVPGLVASLRLLSCSLDTSVPSFMPTESKFSIRKIRAFGDGGSYAIDQFSLVKESTATDVYKLEITVPGLGSITTAPFLVRNVELPDPVAVATSRAFLIAGLPAVLGVMFANMRERHFITFIIATGAIGFYTLIALIYCSDALTLKGLARAPTLMLGSMLVMLLTMGINTALCGIILATYMARTDYYDSNIMKIMTGLSALLTKVKPKSEQSSVTEPKREQHSSETPKDSEVVDLDAIIQARDKPSVWQRLLAFFVTKKVAMDHKSHAEIVAEINAKKRKAMALLFKASGNNETMALSGFSFHSRLFTALSVSLVALLISFLICTTIVDWFEVLLGLGRAKVVQSRWSKVRPDASVRISPPLLFAQDERAMSIANQSIGPQGIMFAVM